MNKHSLLGIMSACTLATTLGNAAQAASLIIDDFNTSTYSFAASTGGPAVTVGSPIDGANIVMDVTGGGDWTRTLSAELFTGDSMATSVCIFSLCGAGYVSMAPGSASGRGIFEYNNDSAIDMSSYTLLGFDWGADLADASVDIIFSDGSNTSTVASWSSLAATTGGALVPQARMGIAWGAVDPTAVTQVQFVVNGVGNLDSSIDNFVAVVPVPAAAWLFGSALLGLAGVRRGKA